jgi:hypothetical protein
LVLEIIHIIIENNFILRLRKYLLKEIICMTRNNSMTTKEITKKDSLKFTMKEQLEQNMEVSSCEYLFLTFIIQYETTYLVTVF